MNGTSWLIPFANLAIKLPGWSGDYSAICSDDDNVNSLNGDYAEGTLPDLAPLIEMQATFGLREVLVAALHDGIGDGEELSDLFSRANSDSESESGDIIEGDDHDDLESLNDLDDLDSVADTDFDSSGDSGFDNTGGEAEETFVPEIVVSPPGEERLGEEYEWEEGIF